MYNVMLYEDVRGYCPVQDDLINILDKTKGKIAKTALKKIFYQIERIQESGTRAGEDITKHLAKNIWEIRPGKYRITYAIQGDNLIVLHYFTKTTRKTPQREIIKAKKLYKDWKKRHGQ
ncbi:type II toxin-antitoxin system RelE/ParE family toxin [Bacillus mycoides]|uniref:type II toxin-antitoxin system RelE/ParE family toxin n=1 Tax=Bacillus mycoides TaxID=1405 RepID=UPI002E1F4ABB|nr:type II toxin-antitoxin system RelE/ParE family toxin [Bacillus mycoides]